MIMELILHKNVVFDISLVENMLLLSKATSHIFQVFVDVYHVL